MSTLKVNAVTDASGGNTATINSMTPTADSLQGFRNRIINGDMRIDQRNAGASVTPTNAQYTLDRYQSILSAASKYSIQQVSDAPTGFVNSLRVTSSSAYVVPAGEVFQIRQSIEGTNVADLGWGTASAKTVTLSFWVRSSLTGTFGGRIQNSAADRNYPFSYTISSANTFEYKTITIAGDTTGTWLTTTGIGVQIRWSLGTGSDFLGTAGAWTASNISSVTGETKVVATSGATWYITGVQLEVGSVATPFERRPYGTELALCQRYYYKTIGGVDPFGVGWNTSTTKHITAVFFPVEMRTKPTALEQSGTANHYRVSHAATVTTCSAVPAFYTASKNNGSVEFTVASGLTTGQGAAGTGADANAYLAWSAEL
jgi:hypothetical protein